MANVQPTSPAPRRSRSSESTAATARRRAGTQAAAKGRPRRARATGAAPKARTTAKAAKVEAAVKTRGDRGLVRWPEVPLVHVRVPVFRVPVPRPRTLIAQTRWASQTARALLPSAARLVYSGGLGALAVAEVLASGRRRGGRGLGSRPHG
jgi:hypothetical protein